MSGNALIRGIFLIAIFPLIISQGRKWFAEIPAEQQQSLPEPEPRPDQTRDAPVATQPEDLDPTLGILALEEPPKPVEPVSRVAGSVFDLFFLRSSLVVDGVVTTCIAFTTVGWHIYLGRIIHCNTRCLVL